MKTHGQIFFDVGSHGLWPGNGVRAERVLVLMGDDGVRRCPRRWLLGILVCIATIVVGVRFPLAPPLERARWPAATGAEGAASSTSRDAGPASKTRNLVLILADDWRMRLPGSKTPALDRFAQETDVASFPNAFTQYPLCNPSRASLLTGARPSVTNVFDLDSRVDQFGLNGAPSLPVFLRKHGFTTLGGGKLFHGATAPGLFDETFAESVQHPYRASLCSPAHFAAGVSRPFVYGARPMLADSMCQVSAAAEGDVIDVRNVRLAVSALERHLASEAGPAPFFLALGLVSTHLPFVTAERFWAGQQGQGLDVKAVDVAPELRSPRADNWSASEAAALRLAYEPGSVHGEPFTAGTVWTRKRRALRLGYRAAVSQLDACVGELLSALERLGLRESTAVVLTSDHGYSLGEFGHYGKRSLDELSLRVPLLVRCPWCQVRSQGQGRVHSQVVESLGLYRSAAGLLGLADAVPAAVQGADWLAVRPGNGDENEVASARESEGQAQGQSQSRVLSESVAVSQVLRCQEPACPTDVTPLAQHVACMGVSARSAQWRLTLWVGVTVVSSTLRLDWSDVRGKALLAVGPGQDAFGRLVDASAHRDVVEALTRVLQARF